MDGHEVMLLVGVRYALPHWVLGEGSLHYLEKKNFLTSTGG